MTKNERETFFLNPLLEKNTLPDEPTWETLLAWEKAGVDPLQTEFVNNSFSRFYYWFSRLAQETPLAVVGQPLFPSHYFSSKSLVSPLPLFAEANYNLAWLSLQTIHHQPPLSEQKIAWAWQMSWGFAHLFDFLWQMAHQSLVWKHLYCKPNHQRLEDYQFLRHQTEKVFYDPSVPRLGFVWQNFNLRGPDRPPPLPQVTEIRLDYYQPSGRSKKACLQLDINCRLWPQGFPSKDKAKEVVHLLFGPNRHHLWLFAGSADDCREFIHQVGKELHLDHLFSPQNVARLLEKK